MACGIAFAAGVVTIEGSALSDRAVVRPSNAGIRVTLDCGNNGVIDHAAVYGPGVVNKIIFNGGKGDDYFRNMTAIASVVHGGLGNDDLHGGSGADRLYGDEGNDCLCGGGGDDKLYGGAGNDLMHGGAGNDWMWGGAGNDTMYGDDGNDQMFGEAGADLLQGLAGNDRLDGGNDGIVDSLFGGAGLDFDVLVGHPGDFLDPNADGPAVIDC